MEGGGELGTDGMDTLTELGDELTLGDIDGGCAAGGHRGERGVWGAQRGRGSPGAGGRAPPSMGQGTAGAGSRSEPPRELLGKGGRGGAAGRLPQPSGEQAARLERK